MIDYEYKCNNCLYEYIVQQRISEYKFNDLCPHCQLHTAERILSEPLAVFDGNVKSLGMQAEINTRRMGKYELESRREADKKSNKAANSALTGEKPFYNTNDVTAKQIQKMDKKQVNKFIMEGKTS